MIMASASSIFIMQSFTISLFMHALPIFVLKTLGHAMQGCRFSNANLDDLRLSSGLFNCIQRVPDQVRCVAVLVGTSIERNDFHRFHQTEAFPYSLISVVSII